MLPKFKYIVVSLIILFSCTATSKTKKELKENKVFQQENIDDDIKINEYTGQIVSENFTNKGGKAYSNIQDLYFQIKNGERYFIKFENSVLSFKEATSLIGKDLKIKAKIIEGLWDVPDDKPQYAQSRMGFYIIIESYEIINE